MQIVYLPLEPTVHLDIDGAGKLITENISGIQVQAESFGELLVTVENECNCRIIKNPELDKYFVYYSNKIPDGTLIDIHVVRNGETICPKHDLGFVLNDDDQIYFGALVC